MDLKEANTILRFSEEEITAIQRYLGFKHLNINILADFGLNTYQSLKDTAWSIDEDPEEIAQNIQDFVNLYSAMYKESKTSNPPHSILVRGTSNARIHSIQGKNLQFLSTTTSEAIAKTFSEYGDDAIAHMRVGAGVPFLDTTPYRSENVRDEFEIVLAPFCSTRVERGGTHNGYTHYQVIMQKTILEEKKPEELDALSDEIMVNFSQNLKDIKELDHLEFKLESLDRAYAQAQGDREEQGYILDDKKKVQEEYDKLVSSTYGFKHKLQDLLQGLCKQKEVEIDKAHEVIQEDRARRKAEREAKEAEEAAQKEAAEKEEARQKLVSELSGKLEQNPQNSSSLEGAVLKTYDDFVHNEEVARMRARDLGVEYTRTIKSTTARKLVEDIQSNLQETATKVEGIAIDENTTLEDAQEMAGSIVARLDGVSYGVEVAQNFPELVDLHKKQIEDEIKRSLYARVQSVLQDARLQKYSKEKESLQSEKIGFFGRLFGKEELRERRLENLDLKMKLAQRSEIPEKDRYSIREMLVDMRICASNELGGKFTPEMQELYQAMMNSFGLSTKEKFSEEYIGKLVSQRNSADRTTEELPVVQGDKPKVFGKTKAQANMIALENQRLNQKLLRLRTNHSIRTQRLGQSQETDAISQFTKMLKGIAVNTQERDRKVDLESTLDLWK